MSERPRIFLLSPAMCGGLRAELLTSPRSRLSLALALRSPHGAAIGDVMAFLSGLYFRGKLAYARAFGRPPAGVPAAAGALVITPHAGLTPVDAPLTLAGLRSAARVDIDADNARYRRPLEASARLLAEAIGPDCDVVLLGSVASPKYVHVLTPIFADRLLFPLDFVGRGDMSRGGLLLRCVAAGQELAYASIGGNATRHGPRPPRLPRLGSSRPAATHESMISAVVTRSASPT
jgi:hypothetical protein